MHSHPRRIVICGVVATVLLGFGWIVLFPEEPKCDGRSLTYWIGALGASDADEEAHAFAAIEAIGTNGLASIIYSLGTRDSALQFQFLRLAQRIPFVHPHFTTPHVRRQKAKEALFLCGEDSLRASISDLVRLSCDKDPGVRLTAVEALSAFPFNEITPMPALRAAEQDPDSQVRAAARQAVASRRAVEKEVQRLRELWPNKRAALDAGRTRGCHADHHWPGPSDCDR
jgi:hypothetical protein